MSAHLQTAFKTGISKKLLRESFELPRSSDLDGCKVLGFLARSYPSQRQQSVAEELLAPATAILEQQKPKAKKEPDTVRLVFGRYADLLDHSNRTDKDKEVQGLLSELVKESSGQ